MMFFLCVWVLCCGKPVTWSHQDLTCDTCVDAIYQPNLYHLLGHLYPHDLISDSTGCPKMARPAAVKFKRSNRCRGFWLLPWWWITAFSKEKNMCMECLKIQHYCPMEKQVTGGFGISPDPVGWSSHCSYSQYGKMKNHQPMVWD